MSVQPKKPDFRSLQDFGSLRAYAQLMRLPNVFTAWADILMGSLAMRALHPEASSSFWLAGILLLAASSCLYCGGMVWNDYFDVEQDRRERPFRPLPSGRIRRANAARLGTALLVCGCLCAVVAGLSATGFHRPPALIAGALALAILLYDRWLKRIALGPLGMAACRFLNVMLGLSLLDVVGRPWVIQAASIVGLYIFGVTWFARTEARISKRGSLVAAALVMLISLVLALPLPLSVAATEASPPHPWLFPYLLVVAGFFVGIPACRAIAQPIPARVQLAVKRSIFGLVILDAALATALAGTDGALLLLLLVPASALGRWVYST